MSPGGRSGRRARLSLHGNHRSRAAEASTRTATRQKLPVTLPCGRVLERHCQRHPGFLFQDERQNTAGLWARVGASAGRLQGVVSAHARCVLARLTAQPQASPQPLFKTQPPGQQGANPDGIMTTGGHDGWGLALGPMSYARDNAGPAGTRGRCAPGLRFSTSAVRCFKTSTWLGPPPDPQE